MWCVVQEGETASFKTVKKYVYLSLLYNASSSFSKLYIYLCFEMLNSLRKVSSNLPSQKAQDLFNFILSGESGTFYAKVEAKDPKFLNF